MTDSTNNDIFNLTGNETPEELEAMLDQMGEFTVSDEPQPEEPTPAEPPVQEPEQSTPGTDTDTAASETAGSDVAQADGEQANAEEAQVIMTKDGKHAIPYAVLEAERNEAARLRQQLEAEQEQLRQEREQREALERESKLLEVRNKQLEEMGIKPADLPEELDMSGEALNELRENYPELAPFIQALNEKIEKASAASVPAATPAMAPQPQGDVMTALNANPDLNAWRDENGDKWKVALDIDDALVADPAWRSKTHTERLAEVARRTKAAFGEDDAQTQAKAEQAKVKAQQAQAKAGEQLPASPSEIGATAKHTGTLAQQAANMSPDELSGLFDTMTPEQVDALLAEVEGF